MAECECVAGCAFFHDKMENMPSMGAIYKTRYCLGDWNRCARHRVFAELGRDKVPSDLFPNEGERATALLMGG